MSVALFFVAVFAFLQLDKTSLQAETNNRTIGVHCEELYCHHDNNSDVENPSPIVLPSVQIRSINGQRTNAYRVPQISVTDNFQIISNYVLGRFIHRISPFARAIDFYLYTLCRLRL